MYIPVKRIRTRIGRIGSFRDQVGGGLGAGAAGFIVKVGREKGGVGRFKRGRR